MLISIFFFAVAALYAAVGFGGGSSYIAILALYDYPYQLIPVLALLCNLIVVVGGATLFTRRGHFNWGLFWPFALSSVPMAFVAGQVPLSSEVFFLLLGACLFLVGFKLLVLDRMMCRKVKPKQPGVGVALLAGGLIGLLSGLVGVGGGIFLSPILLLMGWGTPKQVAATSSWFILVNSAAGLLGQLTKQGVPPELGAHLWLFLAVFLGGQLGSRLSSGQKIPQRWIKDLTAVLVIGVGVRILLLAA